MINTRVASIFVLVAAISGCDSQIEGPPAVAPPAQVENAATEASLTTITLTPQAIERLAIETEQVGSSHIEQSRSYAGVLEVPSGRSFTVSAPVAGTIAAPAGGVVPAPGEQLSSGQEVFRLLPMAPPDQDLLRLEAEAQARYEVAKLRADRAEQLAAEGVWSPQALDEARANLAVADAALKGIGVQLELLHRTADGPGEASTLVLVSPMPARLGALYAGIGQPVAQSTPLFDVFADDPMWIRVPVYVGDLDSIDPSRAAEVHTLGASARTGSPATLTAKAVMAPPNADPNAATVDMFYELGNPNGRWRAGQKVGVTLTLTPGEGGREALTVPRSAILYDSQGGTWVYENTQTGVFVRRRVEVGGIAGETAILVRGPAAGTVVVTQGAAELYGTEFGVGH